MVWFLNLRWHLFVQIHQYLFRSFLNLYCQNFQQFELSDCVTAIHDFDSYLHYRRYFLNYLKTAQSCPGHSQSLHQLPLKNDLVDLAN